MLVFFIAAVVAILSVCGAYRLQRLIDPGGAILKIDVFTFGVLGTGIWLLVSIFGCYFLQVPGSEGLVQYWSGDAEAMRVFNLRGLAALMVFVGAPASAIGLLASLVTFGRRTSGRNLAVAVVPAVAYLVFFLASWHFFACEFFPTV